MRKVQENNTRITGGFSFFYNRLEYTHFRMIGYRLTKEACQYPKYHSTRRPLIADYIGKYPKMIRPTTRTIF